MNTIFLGVITLASVVAVVIFIVVMVELRGAIKRLKELVRTTESSLKPTLVELQQTLKSVRTLADNITNVTEDFQVFSDSVRGVGANVKNVSDHVERLSEFVGNITSTTVAEASGLKAGIRTGFLVFFKNLFRKG